MQRAPPCLHPSLGLVGVVGAIEAPGVDGDRSVHPPVRQRPVLVHELRRGTADAALRQGWTCHRVTLHLSACVGSAPTGCNCQ